LVLAITATVILLLDSWQSVSIVNAAKVNEDMLWAIMTTAEKASKNAKTMGLVWYAIAGVLWLYIFAIFGLCIWWFMSSVIF